MILKRLFRLKPSITQGTQHPLPLQMRLQMLPETGLGAEHSRTQGTLERVLGADVHEVGQVVLVSGLGRQGQRGVEGQHSVDAVFSLRRQGSWVPGQDGTRAFARLGVTHLSRWLLTRH
jgi:hypothetical protein